MINEDQDNEQFDEQKEVDPSTGRVDLVKVMAIGFVVFVYFVIYLKILFIR